MTLEQTPIEKPTKKFDALEFLLAGVKTYEELQARMKEIQAQSPELAAWVVKKGLEGHHEDENSLNLEKLRGNLGKRLKSLWG